ncbi:hypothetical protein OS493_040346, partial [Desmophyllum pertusum]
VCASVVCDRVESRCPSYSAFRLCPYSGWVLREKLDRKSCNAKNVDATPPQNLKDLVPTLLVLVGITVFLTVLSLPRHSYLPDRDVFVEHVKKYELAFSTDGTNFKNYERERKSKVFDGNCANFTPVLNRFNPVKARYVKVLPHDSPSTWVCMRVEL